MFEVAVAAAATVAEEQAELAALKFQAKKAEFEESEKLSSDAWDAVDKKSKELVEIIEDSKKLIEEAVENIEKAGIVRTEAKSDTQLAIEDASKEKSSAESELVEAIEAQRVSEINAKAAAEAVRLALEAQAAADLQNDEAKQRLIAAEASLDSKSTILENVKEEGEKRIKVTDEALQVAMKESCLVEKDTSEKIEAAQNEKSKAEEYAKECDEQKLLKEAMAIVAERVANIATESKETANAEAEKSAADLVALDEKSEILVKVIEADEENLYLQEELEKTRTAARMKEKREAAKKLRIDEANAKALLEKRLSEIVNNRSEEEKES